MAFQDCVHTYQVSLNKKSLLSENKTEYWKNQQIIIKVIFPVMNESNKSSYASLFSQFLKIYFQGLGKWLNGQKHWLLFQRTGVQFLAPTRQFITTVTLVPKDPVPLLTSVGTVHIWCTDTNSGKTHIHLHVFSLNIHSLVNLSLFQKCNSKMQIFISSKGEIHSCSINQGGL